MAKVAVLRTKDISPAIVHQSIGQAIEDGEIDAIYVIGIKNNRTTAWASGDLNQIGLALVALQDLVSKYINDEIEIVEER